MTSALPVRQHINIIDLDRTLIRYDSLRRYFWLFGIRGNRPLRAAWYAASRLSRLIGPATFLYKLVKLGRQDTAYKERIERFATAIVADIDPDAIGEIKKHTDPQTVNVLCTASPEDYATIVANLLDWDVLASTVGESLNTTVRLTPSAKLRAIHARYPPERYEYNLIVSDSPVEIATFSECKSRTIIKRSAIGSGRTAFVKL